MKDDDLRPKAPEGYTVMLGKDVPDPVPQDTLVWDAKNDLEGCPHEWRPSLLIGAHLHAEQFNSWYAVPNVETDDETLHLRGPYRVVSPDTDPKAPQSLAEEAAAIVAGDRAADYGDANDSFARIAKLWSAYTGSHISPWDVAQMMILLKVSRAKTSTKRDTLVDIIGYAECAGQLKKPQTD
jgi:hypothetical protein